MTGQLLLPPAPARVHFVGIGGIGMSGLARILLAWGYRVSGSDANPSDQTDLLSRDGIPVNIGHTDTEGASGADLVVMTAAVKPGNREVDAAHATGVPVVKRAELLGLLANARRCVAVAGSHGKSTTSGMLVSALLSLGAEPSYAVGAVVAATGVNAAPGSGPDMVVEADEYDYSFLHLTPDVAIITNIEYDHPDLFRDQATYDDAFAQFATKVRPGGHLVIADDDRGVHRLLESRTIGDAASVVTFGESDGADWRLRAGDGIVTVAAPDGSTATLRLDVPGRHNARNATAALAALVALGHDVEAAANALSHYRGIGRRFELKGEASGIVVVDDYAHHPTEVRATLRAARDHFPERRLVAAFQPHTYTRTKALLDDFAESFADADQVVVLDIYPSRETDTLGISAADLVVRIPAGAIAGGPAETAAERLKPLLRPGDVVLTIGAGDVTTVGPKLLSRLATQNGSRHG